MKYRCANVMLILLLASTLMIGFMVRPAMDGVPQSSEIMIVYPRSCIILPFFPQFFKVFQIELLGVNRRKTLSDSLENQWNVAMIDF